MDRNEFYNKCETLLQWYGFNKEDENNFVLEQTQQQQVIFNGKVSVVNGPKTIIRIEFSQGSCEILEDGTEIPMENINIKINEQSNEFIMKYEDYEWFEELLKKIL